MTGTITRGKVIRADLANWDGRTATAARLDATGGTVSGLAIGNEVDILQVYGAGSSRTDASIADAIQKIGSTNVTFVFAPGTWTIASNLTIPSNITCHIPDGCIFSVSNGITLTINGVIQASLGTSIFSGSGTVTFGQLMTCISAAWFGASSAASAATNLAAINNAISAVSSGGGGEIFFPPGTYSHSGTLIPKSNVSLLAEAVTFSYTGSGVQMQSATTGVLQKFNIHGRPRFSYGSATTSIQLNSPYACEIDVEFYGASQTAVLMDIEGNSSGGTNPNSNHNAVFNIIRTRNAGTCGTHLKLSGYSSSDGIVTDNWFDMGDMGSPAGCYVYGINFDKWSDSNTFITKPLIVLLGTAAVGIVVNASTPTANAGIYANVFQGGIAIDCFGSPGGDARQGIQVNFSAWNEFGFIECNPVPANGIMSFNPNVYDAEWTQNIAPTNSTNYRYKNFFGMYVGIGQSQSQAYSLYLSSFVLQGTNQASILVADTFSSSNTGTAAGITLTNRSQATAFTIAAYHAVNITDFSKGSGSSLTTQRGIYCPDLTAGGTTNRALDLNVSAGSGKSNIYVAGTAANYLAGALTCYFSTAIPAGGTTGSGIMFSTTSNFGIFFGSSSPTLTAAKGSLYLRSDGSGTSNRAYINTDGGTTWTAITTAA